MAEQFCLRWNNHQSTLVSVFEKLLEKEELIDCSLWAEGQVLRAHKVVLSACSPAFESMLCLDEKKHPIIFLKDVKYLELKAMLDYMYKGEVNISQDQLDSFLKTAEALQVKGLTDQGGGGEEPPAKKGPGRKTCMSDVTAPESPLVGNAPLREGSISPSTGSKRRRRVARRHSVDESESNDCDMQAPAAPPQAVCPPAESAARLAPPPPAPAPSPVVKKESTQELITPKTEYMEEHAEDIEDLTLDDDDDYGEMSKPGTSFGMSQGSTSQDFSQWQQMTDDRTRDEVFMAAQEAINNQSNAQDGCVPRSCVRGQLSPTVTRIKQESPISSSTEDNEVCYEPYKLKPTDLGQFYRCQGNSKTTYINLKEMKVVNVKNYPQFPCGSRGRAASSIDSSDGNDDRYRTFRERNNESCRRSRLLRKQREVEMILCKKELEKRQAILKDKASKLQILVNQFKNSIKNLPR